MNAHVHIEDAARVDPTGTAALRNSFKRDLDRRWLALRRLAIKALAKDDILGLGGASVGSILAASHAPHHAPIPGSDKVKGFQTWIDEAMRQLITGHDGSWTQPYVARAAEMGKARAGRLTGREVIVRPTRVGELASITVVELQGIVEAVSQATTRVLGHDMLAARPPQRIARDVAARIDAVGKSRSRQMAAYMVVKAFNSATLDAFRSLGIKRVGVAPERLRIKRGPHGKTLVRDSSLDALFDAPRNTPQLRHGITGQFIPHPRGPGHAPTPKPSAREIERAYRGEAKVQALEEVEVITAGDDDVCFVCEDISDDGPYDIDEAESLIPAHPNCRCAFVPAQDERYADVHEDDDDLEDEFTPDHWVWDAFNPDQERVPAGQPGGGEFGSSGRGSAASQRERIGELLRRGTTTEEILRVTGWPSVSVPAQAHASGLHLERYREGGVMRYRGTPYTPEQRAAVVSQLRARTEERAQRETAARAPAAPSAPSPAAPAAAAPAPSPTSTAETQRQSSEVLSQFRENTSGRTMTPTESGTEVVRAAIQLGHGPAAASAAMSNNTRETMIRQFGSIEHAYATVQAEPRAAAQPKPEGGKKETKPEDFAKAGIRVVGSSNLARVWNDKMPMSPEEFKKSFLGETKVKDMTIDGYRNSMTIAGKIVDGQRVIGSFRRDIDLERKVATSSYFSITDASRAHGIGKEMLAANMDTYKKMGISEVNVHANIDVGGYAWARYGYVPTPSSWSSLKDTISSRLDHINDPSKDQMKTLLQSKDPKMLWVIADHKLGKQLLLNTDWQGTIKMSDTNTMRRFDAYVHQK